VPDLFTIRFDVGPDAPVAAVAEAISDLRDVTGAATGLAVTAAGAEARRALSDLIDSEGARALASRYRRHELPDAERFDMEVDRLEQLTDELDYFWREVGPLPPSLRRATKRSRYARWLAEAYAADPWSRTLDANLQTMFARLVAAETAIRLPRGGCRMRSLRYSNPAVTEIVTDAGVLAAAVTFVLGSIVTLGSRYRRERARADAEERIQEANARDVEDLAARRIELRRILIDRIARGDIDLRPEDVTDALLDQIEGAADRLADRELVFNRETIADDG
jgi:hypothetical protein